MACILIVLGNSFYYLDTKVLQRSLFALTPSALSY